jgi:hypothetical protein
MNGNAQPRADFLQAPRGIDLQLARLDDAGPGDQEKRLV